MGNNLFEFLAAKSRPFYQEVVTDIQSQCARMVVIERRFYEPTSKPVMQKNHRRRSIVLNIGCPAATVSVVSSYLINQLGEKRLTGRGGATMSEQKPLKSPESHCYG